MGTDERPARKAQEDYAKRTAHPSAASLAKPSFVFVTPRQWQEKTRWCEEKRAEGIWKDVLVFDSADLEEWLEHAPAVDLWLARLLGKPTHSQHWLHLAPTKLRSSSSSSTSLGLGRQERVFQGGSFIGFSPSHPARVLCATPKSRVVACVEGRSRTWAERMRSRSSWL